MSGILPDCTLCDGSVVLDFDGAAPVEVCQRCGAAHQHIGMKVNLRDLREQIVTVVEARPVLCDPCVIKRCTACVTANCDCPRQRHPRRPAGDVTAEGLALLARQESGHLEVAELVGGDR